MPDFILKVFKKVDSVGGEIYLVGGSVRDILMGSSPNDYDMATSLLPEEIEDLFKDYKTINIGKKFGTIGILIDQTMVEITTFRMEENYIDGRRPESISFASNILEDLKRRDFTLNAIAYSPRTGLIDPFSGREDINRGLIKAVGNPIERFNEDGLRLLRCVRFATRYNYKIDLKTKEALYHSRTNLYKISNERIREEIFKILLSDKPSLGFEILRKNKILDIILPELLPMVGFDQENPNHYLDVYEHTLEVIDNTPKKLHIRLAALFHDVGKPRSFSLDCKNIGHFYGHQYESVKISSKTLKRLNTPNELIKLVIKFIESHMIFYDEMKEKGYKRLLNKIGEEYIYDFISLQKADRLASKNKNLNDLIRAEKQIRNILENQEPFNKKDLAINGVDVIELGYKEGRIIGKILNYSLELVMENKDLNKKELLIDLIKDKFK